MEKIAIGLVVGIAAIIVVIQMIKIFESIDDEVETAINKKDRAVIIILGSLYGILSAVFIWKNQYGLVKNIVELLNVTLLFIYLTFQSYFDQKIKNVYSTISILMIPIEIIYVTYIMIGGYNKIYGFYTLAVLIAPIILWVISLFRGIGFGDVLIYLVIAIYYIGAKQQPVISMLLNIIATNITFIVTSIIIKMGKFGKKKHKPLTMYIAITTILFAILNV